MDGDSLGMKDGLLDVEGAPLGASLKDGGSLGEKERLGFVLGIKDGTPDADGTPLGIKVGDVDRLG